MSLYFLKGTQREAQSAGEGWNPSSTLNPSLLEPRGSAAPQHRLTQRCDSPGVFQADPHLHGTIASFLRWTEPCLPARWPRSHVPELVNVTLFGQGPLQM